MTPGNTAVLLIAFNRPVTTLAVFDCIRRSRPERLYIAVDGPRLNNPDDLENCRRVRAIKEKVDWPCVVKTRYSEKNLGCKYGVAYAISWFFENESEGIILEDDIIPEKEFFQYCNLMLNLYRNNKNIKAILGFNLYGQNVKSNSHFMYEGFYPWGWATWKRAWTEYYPDNLDLKKIKSLINNRKSHKFLYRSVDLNLRLVKKGFLDTWDYQFMYMMICSGGYSIAPNANLIKNIGVDGAHSAGNRLDFAYGTLDVEKIDLTECFAVDEKMNSLFLLEHERGSRLVLFKKILDDLKILLVATNET